MPAFEICQSHSRTAVPFPALQGVFANGDIQTEALFPAAGRPLRAWVHALQPGATIEWRAPPVGHGIYVLSGRLESGGEPLEQAAAVLVEHGAAVTVRAGAAPASILHFHRDERLGEASRRDGGHVHAMGTRGLLQFQSKRSNPPHGGTLYADSACPTCELWLHTSLGWGAGSSTSPHYHSVDEVIFVLDGSMLFGREELGAGGAVAIDANTTYKFDAGKRGLSFVNFRPADPSYVPATRDGNPVAPVNERDLVRAMRVSG